jgi:hypothetical protein
MGWSMAITVYSRSPRPFSRREADGKTQADADIELRLSFNGEPCGTVRATREIIDDLLARGWTVEGPSLDDRLRESAGALLGLMRVGPSPSE